jgi:hypothetical protein
VTASIAEPTFELLSGSGQFFRNIPIGYDSVDPDQGKRLERVGRKAPGLRPAYCLVFCVVVLGIPAGLNGFMNTVFNLQSQHKKHLRLITYALWSLLLGLYFAFVGRGDSFLLVLLLALFLFGGIPALLALIVRKATSVKKETKHRSNELVVCHIILIVIGMQILTWPVGWMLKMQDIDEAKAICNELVRRLEAEKQANGSYPADIARLLKDQNDFPRSVHGRPRYMTHEGEYTLSFVVPAGPFPWQYSYSSQSRTWEVTD